MALNAEKVNVAITGAVSFAVPTATIPTNATSALDAAFRDVGYIGEDGVEEARDRDTNEIIAWQGAAVVRTVVTKATISVKFTMIETNPNSVELFYAAPVDGPTGSVTIIPSATGGRRRYVVDYIDGDMYVRMLIAQGEILEVDEVKLASGEAVGYGVTVIGYPDESLGYSAKKWFSDLIVP